MVADIKKYTKSPVSFPRYRISDCTLGSCSKQKHENKSAQYVEIISNSKAKRTINIKIIKLPVSFCTVQLFQPEK